MFRQKKSEYERLTEEERKLKSELGYLGEMSKQRRKVQALRQAKQRLSGGSGISGGFKQLQGGVASFQKGMQELNKYQPDWDAISGVKKRRRKK